MLYVKWFCLWCLALACLLVVDFAIAFLLYSYFARWVCITCDLCALLLVLGLCLGACWVYCCYLLRVYLCGFGCFACCVIYMLFALLKWVLLCF